MFKKGIVNADNINFQDGYGRTALRNACYYDADKTAKLLIKYGADISDAHLDRYPLIKTIRDYQEIDANVDDSEEYWLAIANKMVILSASYDEMKEFVLERPLLEKYLFAGIDLNVALDMFNGDWQDFFKQCYTNSIDVSEIASNSNIPAVVLNNALLYGVHWENVDQDSNMIKNFVNMLIDNPQLLKNDDALTILYNDFQSALSICEMYLDGLVAINSPETFEIFLLLDAIHPELWDKYYDKFEDTRYFARERYYISVNEAQVLRNWSHGKSEVELGKIGDTTVVVPINCAQDSHAVWLFFKAIAKNAYGDSVDTNGITKEAVKKYDANVLKILQTSGFDMPIDEIANDAVENHDLKTLKFLHANGFDMTTNIVLCGETVEL